MQLYRIFKGYTQYDQVQFNLKISTFKYKLEYKLTDFIRIKDYRLITYNIIKKKDDLVSGDVK